MGHGITILGPIRGPGVGPVTDLTLRSGATGMMTKLMERAGMGMAGMGMTGMGAPTMGTGMMGGTSTMPSGMNMMMVPRCTMTMEKCPGGMKITCTCEDATSAGMLQNLC